MLSKPSICIISPALAAANNGNWQTAMRWQYMLSKDYHVEIMLQWDGKPYDAMLALHARKSADSIAAWAASCPAKPIVLVLTGTDLYRDIAFDAQAQQSLKHAHRLLVLQELGANSLPLEYQSKCQVIYQSTPRRQAMQKTTRKLRALMVGHLRSEKSPETYFAAARALAHRQDILLDHIGAPLDVGLGQQAQQLAADIPSYRYLGEQSHAATRARIARAHVLVHPSRMEGGAHVVMEAVMSGTPVLASRIDGNVGMLGGGYDAYFPVGDAQALANLLLRCQNEPAFLDHLNQQCALRSTLFEPLAEQTALLQIVSQVI
ncbi:MAG: TIGR04348 family glycosyltransferase [Polaromonas sp.]|jgi:putative glycosyltransferase (TIGR04348 family)|nr:TIGR04348 family glycosyltransferase [Polaromonas sp.]MBP7116052.1 TIGR04348 family glycosyltransferase [Polaromonas sp.]MBP7308620.1 TIGR04348 family glycosyltransferase [Polaromonas sp.]MBP9830780.1 TIGR04348 family glycosyltransferase [Polaromonas sp.]